MDFLIADVNLLGILATQNSSALGERYVCVDNHLPERREANTNDYIVTLVAPAVQEGGFSKDKRSLLPLFARIFGWSKPKLPA